MSSRHHQPANRISFALQFEKLEPKRVLATLTVTTFTDVIDDTDGVLSLREAIVDSNSNNEDDVIELSAGTYEFAIDGFDEDLGLTGDFDVLSDAGHSLVIRGLGADMTTIDAMQLDRVFNLVSQSNLTLEDMTLQNGSVIEQTVPPGRRGGAIRSTQSSLTLNNLVIQDSTTGDLGFGGAVWISGGEYAINQTDMIANQAGNGIAVFARNSTGTILGGSFRDNRAIGYVLPDQPANISVVNIRAGTLSLKGTRIDDNRFSTGIAIEDGTLSVDHGRFLDQDVDGTMHVGVQLGNGVFARGSDVTIHDSRFSLMAGNAIDFLNPAGTLTITESLFRQNYGSTINFEGERLVVDDVMIQQDLIANLKPVLVANAGGMERTIVLLTNVTMESVPPNALLIDRGMFDLELLMDNVNIVGADTASIISQNFVDIDANGVTLRNSRFQGASDAFLVDADLVAMENVTFVRSTSEEFSWSSVIRTFVLSLDGVSSDMVLFFSGMIDVDIRNSNFSNGNGRLIGSSRNTTTITNTVFANNVGSKVLSWSVLFDGSLRIYNSVFDNNRNSDTTDFSNSGTVEFSGSGDILIANTRFTNNQSSGRENIRIIQSSSLATGTLDTTITNSLFANNDRVPAFSGNNNDGSLIVVSAFNLGVVTLNVHSSTFVDNGQSRGKGGAIYATKSPLDPDSSVTVNVTNSVFVGNGMDASMEFSQIFNRDGAISVTYSNLYDYNPGDGTVFYGGAANNNNDLASGFVDYPGRDYRLRVDSSLKDLGNAAEVILDEFDLDEDGNFNEPLPDLDLLERIVGSSVDIGAFEIQAIPRR